MLLSEIGLQTRTINALHKKRLFTTEDILRYVPYKYYDFRRIMTLKEGNGTVCAVSGKIIKTKTNSANKRTVFTVTIETDLEHKIMRATWIGQKHVCKIVEEMEEAGGEVVVYGNLKFDPQYGYSMLNPLNITYASQFKSRILPVYENIKGVSSEMLDSVRQTAFSKVDEPVRGQYLNGKESYLNAYKKIHQPVNMEDIKKGQNTLDYIDLLYYATKMKINSMASAMETDCRIVKRVFFDQMVRRLPFHLTKDQASAVSGIIKQVNSGKRANALIQGDVGCGKSVVAFLLMMAFAENGYQSVLMAPTAALASQHATDLENMVREFGYEVAFIHGGLTEKEKKEVFSRIESGEIMFIVGTHTAISDRVIYKNLALTIVDEEHKFGVIQRDKLLEKAMDGVNTISMSATPIPRTLASAVYGIDKTIYDIKSIPDGREPVQTAICNSDKAVFGWIEKQLKDGRQCYVICPMITEENNSELLKNVSSVEETYRVYMDHFKDTDYKIAVVTGETQDASEILQAFKRNEYQILISTTVIEVGVNVPNANVIVINNAERFGLSGLHQLRGRVGRGNHKSYCILKSADKDNKRLNVLVNTTNGFKIAEEDFKLRGSGNFIGEEQSGFNHYVKLMMDRPDLYQEALNVSESLIADDTYTSLLQTIE